MSAGSLSRWVRAALFAAVCVALSATGHVLMSGSDVAPWALVATFLATGSGAWVAACRERGPVAIVGGLLGAQAVLHHLFAWAQQRPAPMQMSMQMPMGTAHADVQTWWIDALVWCGAPHGASTMGHGGHGSLGMIAVHGLAALVCGLWLWRGETAVFRLLRCVGMLAELAVGALRLLIVCFVPPVRRPRLWAVSRAWLPVARLRAALLCHVLSRRGPPQGLAYC